MRVPRRRGWRRLIVLVAAGAVGLAGCTSAHRSAPPSRSTAATSVPVAVTWRPVPMPPGAVRLSRVASAGQQLLVSGQRGSGDAAPPGIWRRDVHGAWLPVRLAPATYYGRRAELFRLVSDGRRVVALGRRIGGTHGNPRVTSWTGTLEELHETEQPFELFGGPDAISVSDLALDAHGGVALGAWAPHGEASGVAVWRQQGTGWQRFDRVPGLASQVTVAGSDLTSPGAIAVRGGEPVLVGRTVHLGGGVRLQATLWQPTGDTWQPVALPSDGDALARALACGAEVCTVAGSSSGRLAVWEVRGTAVTPVRVPALDVDDRKPVQMLQVGGAVWLAVGQATTSTVLRIAAGSVRVLTPPPGQVTSVAVVGSSVVALTSGVSGSTSLWQTAG